MRDDIIKVNYDENKNHLYVVGKKQISDETPLGEPSCWITLPNKRKMFV